MTNMLFKSLFVIGLIITLPYYAFSQSKKDSLSEVEIDSLLTGTWDLKESEYNSQFVFSNSIEDGLICKVFQYLEDDEESSKMVHETKVDITENETGYNLRWDYPLFFWKGRIEKLKSRQLVVEINGNSLKFIKQKD